MKGKISGQAMIEYLVVLGTFLGVLLGFSIFVDRPADGRSIEAHFRDQVNRRVSQDQMRLSQPYP